MAKNEKASLMRVVADLIKADGIIDCKEISYLEKMRARYHIAPDDECMAEKLTFADALHILLQSDAALRQQLITDFTEVAMSDNYCARAEALLILALRYCLENENNESVSMLSVNNDYMQFDDTQILYVECQYDAHVNSCIEAHYDELASKIRLAGFDFVYIPRLQYDSIQPEVLFQTIKFLYPSVSNERAQNVQQRLCHLTTPEFCRDLLSAKLGVKQMLMIAPSLMVKVGESEVEGRSYSNFMLLELGKDIVSDINKLLATFAQHFSNMRLNYWHNTSGHFVYKGFYRQLFDLLMLRRGIKSTVVIDTVNGHIRFPDADAKIEKIHRREKALYALFMLEAANGGINFTPPTGGQKSLDKFNRHMDRLMQKYRMIYAKFGGTLSKAPNICDYSTRGPMLALLKKQIKALGNLLYHVDSYCIVRNELLGNYTIDLPATMFYCSNEDGELVPLLQDEEWQHIAAI
jgi:hypothetical protein